MTCDCCGKNVEKYNVYNYYDEARDFQHLKSFNFCMPCSIPLKEFYKEKYRQEIELVKKLVGEKNESKT